MSLTVFLDVGEKEVADVDISDMDGVSSTGPSSSYPTCGICLDVFVSVHSPYAASLAANSSSRLPYGLRLPCPEDHGYCLSCLTSYIQSKLDGIGTIVFPIRCPECPLGEWVNGIPDEVAERVLDGSGMVSWESLSLYPNVSRA